MRTLLFKKKCEPTILCEELAALPALQPINGEQVFTLFVQEDEITIELLFDLPPDVDNQITEVVTNHDGERALWEQAAKRVRVERNARLRECDWTQLPDVPLEEEEKEAWRVYRQALRDLPNQPDFDPFNVIFPEPPNTIKE